MSAEKRKEILETALTYVTKDRNSSYGEPEDNFNNIAMLWNAYLKSAGYRIADFEVELDATDVAIMNALIKVARLSTNPGHKDSWIDLAGYAACGGGIQK